MLLLNLKHSINSLKRNRIFSILNLTGLSIGLTVVTLIALFLMSEYSKDENIPDHENIYRLYDAQQKNCALDYNLNRELSEHYPEIKKACAVRTFFGFDVPLTSEKNIVVEKKAFLTTNAFFDMFDIDVLESISREPLPDPESAVITKSLANKLFPDEDALGKRINLFGFADMTITAIIEDFSDKSLNCNFITHAENPKFKNFGQTNNVTMSSHYFDLKSNADPGAFESKLNKFIADKKRGADSVSLQKLDDIYLRSAGMTYNAHESGNRKMLSIFLVVSVLIMLLSVINNFNYTISLQYSNFKDIGVRKTNGAGKLQLLNMFLTDTLVKVFVSVAVSIILTCLALPLLSTLTEHKLSVSSLLSKTFIFPAFLLLLLFILINSIASIYIFSKFDIRTFLAGGKSKSNSHTGRNILTVFQLTISAALLISIIVIKKQISFVKHSDIGFDRENLIRVNFPIGVSEANAVTFKNKVSQLSFVLSASLSNGVPGMINHTSTSNVEDNEFEFVDLLVDDDFVRTMGISLKAGRDFRDGERNDICIINETAFKKYGWDDFEGKHFEGWGKLDVIGIVSDFNISSLHSLPAPVCLIFGDKRDDYAQLSLRMRKGNTGQMLKGIENEWHSMFPALPFYYTFYDQFFDSMYKKEEKVSSILTFLTFLAFLITCSGIFGVSFQNSIIRTKEIGIRKVNGAKIREVLVILNNDFVRQTIFALIIAIPLSYLALNKWLQGFAYKTSQNIWIFVLAVMVTLSLVIVTVSLQALRIARLNPVDALRYE